MKNSNCLRAVLSALALLLLLQGCSDSTPEESGDASSKMPVAPSIAPKEPHVPLDVTRLDHDKHRKGIIAAAKYVLTDPYCLEVVSGSWENVTEQDDPPPTKTTGRYYIISCRVNDLTNLKKGSNIDDWWVKENEVGKPGPIFRAVRSNNERFYQLCSTDPDKAVQEYGPQAISNCVNDNLPHE